VADRETEVLAKIASGVAGLNARAWDRLAGQQPFVSHAFLSALEDSGSVGHGTGWTPAPILVEDDESHLVAAAPAYLKTHSQGEYVFDHGWAEAWQHAGGAYYPKLQVAVPFTPVPGPRLLGSRPQQLIAAIEAVTVQNALSSAHITFIDEPGAAECDRRGWLMRDGVQYHWLNRGYGSFDEFLGALSSRKWGRPYLTRAFFDLIGETMGDQVLLLLAYRGPLPIAGALNFIGPDALYGRYWGTVDERPFLHFELCYYQAIEWACDHGLARVEAGAQGEHKVARGYEPVITRSAHFIPNRSFREAVAEFVEAERAAIANEIAWLRQELPYRSSSSE
jgi:predicted N-acyltransferase